MAIKEKGKVWELKKQDEEREARTQFAAWARLTAVARVATGWISEAKSLTPMAHADELGQYAVFGVSGPRSPVWAERTHRIDDGEDVDHENHHPSTGTRAAMYALRCI